VNAYRVRFTRPDGYEVYLTVYSEPGDSPTSVKAHAEEQLLASFDYYVVNKAYDVATPHENGDSPCRQ